MNLTYNTKSDLHTLLSDYTKRDRLVDANFVKSALDILNNDENIEGKIKYKVSNKLIRSKFKYVNGVNYFDINEIRQSVTEYPSFYREHFDEEYEAIIANIFAMNYLLYNIIKTTQRLGLTGFEELDRMYYDMYQKLDSLTKSQYNKYLKSQKDVSINRSARVKAFKALCDIYQLNKVRLISDLQYLHYLLDGYEQGIASPVHIDFNYLGLEYDKYDFRNIPFLEALEHGVTEDGLKIERAASLRKDYFEDKKSFDVVYKELEKE